MEVSCASNRMGVRSGSTASFQRTIVEYKEHEDNENYEEHPLASVKQTSTRT
jgi:hypothetical protein